MKRIYTIGIMSIVCFSLSGMNTVKSHNASISLTILAAYKDNNLKNEMSLHGKPLSAIPLSIPRREYDKVEVHYRYLSTPYSCTYEIDAVSTPFCYESKDIEYDKVQDQKTVLKGFEGTKEITTLKVLINDESVVLPCREDERIYILLEKEKKKPRLIEFLDTQESNEHSIISNTQRICLDYINKKESNDLRKAIQEIQCFDFKDTVMTFQEVGNYKKAIVAMFNNKINAQEKLK